MPVRTLSPVGHETGKPNVVASRLRGLPGRTVEGIEVPVAVSSRTRLLGLSYLDADRAGPGLLIPDCRSVHTFGMCFPLDVLFLDEEGAVIRSCPGVKPRRCLFTKGAHSVLELVPVQNEGGEVSAPDA